MASAQSIADFRRFTETGICDCGRFIELHRETEDAERCGPLPADVTIPDGVPGAGRTYPQGTPGADCVLSKQTIHAWHQPRFEPGQSAYPNRS